MLGKYQNIRAFLTLHDSAADVVASQNVQALLQERTGLQLNCTHAEMQAENRAQLLRHSSR